MRFLIVVSALISALAAASGALAETAQGPGTPKPAAPKMDETLGCKDKSRISRGHTLQTVPGQRQISKWATGLPWVAGESFLPAIQSAESMNAVECS